MKGMFDPKKIREDFPIFKRPVKGQPLVYLDSAATTQRPNSVVKAMDDYYRTYNANVHRGAYTLSDEATQAYENARDKVSRFINATRRESVVFTRGTTESINLVASSWGRTNLKPGDEILLSVMEHHSNLVPWQMAAQQTGAGLRFIPLTPDGRLDLEKLPQLLSARTKIVSLTCVSNVLGTINPVASIIKQAHAVGAVVMIDGAQAAPHIKIDVQAIDCDFLAFSGHKMLGPTGTGVLYGKLHLLEAMPPYHGGGDMIVEVQLERSTYREPPGKFEAGTPNIAGVIGLGAAIDYLNHLGMEAIQTHERTLVRVALDELKRNKDIEIYGPIPERSGVVAFNMKGVHPHDVATILDEEGIAIRAGHHCAQPLMQWLNVPATNRASFYIYNTEDNVVRLVSALGKVREIFSAVPVA